MVTTVLTLVKHTPTALAIIIMGYALNSNLTEMKESLTKEMSELNVKIATVIEKSSGNSNRIDRLENHVYKD